MKPSILTLSLLLVVTASHAAPADYNLYYFLKLLKQKTHIAPPPAKPAKTPAKTGGKQQTPVANTPVSGASNQTTAQNAANTGIVAAYAYPNPPGDNWNYSNANPPGGAPTTIRPDGTFDVILPAQAGDTIRYEFSGRINTSATSGLVLSVWSIGGGTVRDWSSNATGLQSVSGVATVPAANTGSINAAVTNTVEAGDIDANGMVTLRMYAANTAGSGLQKALFIDYEGNGVINQARGVNFKSFSAAAIAETYTAYPGNRALSSLRFSTSTPAYGLPSPLNASGGFDLVVPAKTLDIISYHLHGSVNAASGLAFSVWSIGGAVTRCWSDGTTVLSNNSGIYVVNSGNAQPVDATIANRVLPTDLDSDNNVTLRLYAINTTGSGLQQHTFLGADNSGNPSYAQAVNYQNSQSYVLTDSQPWEGKVGSQRNSEQEPSVWVDNNGLFNMLYTGGTSNHTGWATATSPAGPWTKYAANPVIGGGALAPDAAMRNTVLYQNGVLYVYFAQEDGNLYVAHGADPAHLTLNPAPILTAADPLRSLENSAVVLGPNATYYLFYEGLYQATGLWQLGVATAGNPLGPFTQVPGGFPLTSLQVADGSATDGPWVEWTGGKFRMVYHAAPVALGNVPSQVYTAESTDGVNWRWPSVNADGVPTPIRTPYVELNHNQAADPFVLKYQGSVYLYHTEQAGDVSNGGIVVNNPALLSNPIDY
ncbi:MAG: hypothetical protein PHW13_07565 [Methylococcales bacterium]|nr:hypothetical protein [Methylococcales bacterium]